MHREALPAMMLLLAALSTGCSGGQSPGGRSASGKVESGPGMVLSGMVMTEVRPWGVRYRLTADRATYALAGKTVAATGVIFDLSEPAGEVHVTAPSVTWNIEAQSAAFPEGGEADSPEGYTAKVQVAALDLRERVFTANGPATFSGPGFKVDGVDLVWRLREGKADLKQPKSVIDPAVVAGKRG